MLNNNFLPRAIWLLATCWLQPQMEQRFGPLPNAVRDVFATAIHLNRIDGL
jgi:hypothetical protein